MQLNPIHHPFPLGRTIAVMSVVAVVVLLIQLALVPWLFGSPQGSIQAVLLMGALVWLSGVLSVLPMSREQGRGPLAVVKVFFLGMGVRAVVAVVAIIIAVKRLSLPLGPSGVATMMMYLPLLFVETRMLADYVRKYDALRSKDSGQGKGEGTQVMMSDAKPQATQEQAAKNSDSMNNNTAPCTEALA